MASSLAECLAALETHWHFTTIHKHITKIQITTYSLETNCSHCPSTEITAYIPVNTNDGKLKKSTNNQQKTETLHSEYQLHLEHQVTTALHTTIDTARTWCRVFLKQQRFSNTLEISKPRYMSSNHH